MSNQNLVDTVEITPTLPSGLELSLSSRVEVDLAGLTDPGRVRANNEDTFFIARFDRAMRALDSNLPVGEFPELSAETSYGMVIADGVGGHAAGEVASRTTVIALLDMVLKTPDWIMRLNEQMIQEIVRRMGKRLFEIQNVLAKKAKIDSGLWGMGTTLTLAWSLGADLLVAHVGDSRAYLMSGGQLRQLTRDQTVVQAMVDAGTLTPEEAARHHMRHILTGALSTAGVEVPLEFLQLRLEDGDQVLLCSDGLTDMVPDQGIEAVLRENLPAKAACEKLVKLALDAGGRDNVTVVVARYGIPPARK